MGRTKGVTVINTAKKTVQGFEQLYAQLQQKVDLDGLLGFTAGNPWDSTSLSAHIVKQESLCGSKKSTQHTDRQTARLTPPMPQSGDLVFASDSHHFI